MEYVDFAKGIARAIRFWRRTRYLSQSELAAKVGVSRGRVAIWEAGRSPPTMERLWGLGRALDVEPADLVRAAKIDLATFSRNV